jgi:hypothetical protein
MGCPNKTLIGDTETLVFSVTTHNPSTGAASDADNFPSYNIYENETQTAILTGTMSKLDDSNTLGFYSESITTNSINFKNRKTYTIYVSAIVGGITGVTSFSFMAYSKDTVSLNDPATEDIISGIFGEKLTSGGVATFEDIIKVLYAMAKGKIERNGNAFTYFDDDGVTSLYTVTIDESERTNS